VVSAKRSLERYPEISVHFADSREAKFLAVSFPSTTQFVIPFSVASTFSPLFFFFDIVFFSLQELTKACENYDVEAFTNATVEYDSISRLDPWYTSVLLKIKDSIKIESNDLT
jgi:hypothetical protein